MEGFKIKKKVIDEYKNIGNIDDKNENTVDNEINTLKYVKDTDKHDISILDIEQIIEDWFTKKENNQIFISYLREDTEAAKKVTKNTVDNEINILKYVKGTDKHNIPILDSEQMIEDWFPKNENNQVFISHSHEDAEVAKKLSLYLKKIKGWNCFIDSDVWGSCYKLIKKIDDVYNRLDHDNEGNLYSYEGCQKTTSDIYLMLTTAINKVINTCQVFIFIESESSVEDSITYSPWIMEELNTFELLSAKNINMVIKKDDSENNKLMFLMPRMKISYKVDEILETMQEIKNINEFRKIDL